MASKRRSSGTATIPISLHEWLLSLLRDELKAKNEQIALLQKQLSLALDDKFFKPEIPTRSDPKANQLGDIADPDGQEYFDHEADAKELGEGLNKAIEQVATEQGFPTDWKEEHKA